MKALKTKKLFAAQGLFWLAMALLPNWAFALATTSLTPQQRCDALKKQFQGIFDSVPYTYCTASGIMVFAINILLTFAGTAAVLFLMIGAFWYLTSAGNEESVEKGRKTMINAVIGLVVIMLAAAIVKIIATTLAAG